MTTPTIYLETTVVGHLAARRQTDVVVAARQLASQRWWDVRLNYDVFVSQIVVDECAAGDPVAAAERIKLIETFPLLDIKPEADRVAQSLMTFHGIPASEPRDALHIAVAAVNGVDFLLTWNFRHIANAATRNRIEQICRDAGFVPPTICSPDELLGT